MRSPVGGRKRPGRQNGHKSRNSHDPTCSSAEIIHKHAENVEHLPAPRLRGHGCQRRRPSSCGNFAPIDHFRLFGVCGSAASPCAESQPASPRRAARARPSSLEIRALRGWGFQVPPFWRNGGTAERDVRCGRPLHAIMSLVLSAPRPPRAWLRGGAIWRAPASLADFAAACTHLFFAAPPALPAAHDPIASSYGPRCAPCAACPPVAHPPVARR